MLVERFDQNKCGRDFVVGDIHGCTDMFMEALARVSFDKRVDRVFSVGDLIDRGPDPIGALHLLDNPWFHAVQGNHEDLMHGSLDGTWDIGVWLYNGGEWMADVPEEILFSWADTLRKLPFVISVGRGDCRFNVLHAEFFGTDEDIDNDRIPVDGKEASVLWGRSLISGHGAIHQGVILSAAGLQQPGLSTTYVGHTIVPCIKRIGSHVFIDTGAFRLNGTLTLMEPATGNVVSVEKEW